MSNHKDFTNDLLLGVVVGGVVGALAAILLTPKSGRQLIDDISKSDGFFSKKSDIGDAESWSAYAMKLKSEGGKNPLLLGSVAGALLGAVSGLLLAPRPGSELLSALSGQYQEISDKTLSLIENINQKSQEIALGMSSQTAEWAENTLNITDSILCEVSLWEDAIKEAANRATAQAEFMKEPERQEKILEALDWAQKALALGENVTTEIRDWAKAIKDLAERVRKHPDTFDEEPKLSNGSGNTAKDVLEWAALGVNLWQNIKKRR